MNELNIVERKPITWWRYPVGITVCFATIIFAPVICFQSVGLDLFLCLFVYAISTGFGFLFMYLILPKHKFGVSLGVGIIVAIIYTIASILNFTTYNDPVVGIGFILGIVITIICLTTIKKEAFQANKKVEN